MNLNLKNDPIQLRRDVVAMPELPVQRQPCARWELLSVAVIKNHVLQTAPNHQTYHLRMANGKLVPGRFGPDLLHWRCE